MKQLSRTQLRDSLRKVSKSIDKYENLNTDRQDFLQGKYADYVPSDSTTSKDINHWKTDGEFCVVGWLAVDKDIEFPHYIHDLKKTGYVFKGEQEVTKWKTITDENDRYVRSEQIGTEMYKYPVEERACECELHTEQDEENRNDWIDDDYSDEGIEYADWRTELVPNADKEIMGDEYKEYFVQGSVDLTSISSRAYLDMQRFVMDLMKAYDIPHVLIDHLQMINDTPSFSMLHSLLGNCGKGFYTDEPSAFNKNKCQNEYVMTTDLGGWKKPIVDYLKTELADTTDFDNLMKCRSDFSTLSIVLLRAFINLLLTSDEVIDYYMDRELMTETDELVRS